MNFGGMERRGTPYVTYGLIGLSALVFLYEISLAGVDLSSNRLELTRFFHQWGLIPSELSHLFSSSEDSFRRDVLGISSPIPTWGTAFSSMFIHAGWMHLLGNMLFLWVLGDNVEGRFGHGKFLVFYLVAGLAAVGLHTAVNFDSETPVVGASGAIYGVAGAYLVLYPRNLLPIVIWFVFPNVQGLGFSSTVGGGVAYLAHVGGFVFGILVTGGFKLAKGESLWPWRGRNPWDNFPRGYRDYR